MEQNQKLLAEFLSTLPARGATGSSAQPAARMQFLSTLPARGATLYDESEVSVDAISIHAPREGSDGTSLAITAKAFPFLSTLPARGATSPGVLYDFTQAFLSTLPARGATDFPPLKTPTPTISIHAPREGSDRLVEPALF